MVVQDRIYGRIAVDEPVIAELIGSGPMRRLKDISQDGAPHFIQPIRNVTRYEHSIGAWYLSHRFNRPIEEQIATLLHDVPHTAFSHVIDFVMHDEKYEYHDHFTKEIILRSDIPAICARHGVAIEKVLDKEGFTLLENNLPDISFDRWDYFMRDGFTLGLLPRQVVRLFLASMRERGERFYFEEVRVASLFAVLYMNCCRLIWLDPTSHGAFYVLAEALRRALDTGVLTPDDFFQTDAVVLKRLQSAHDAAIDALLVRLQPGREFSYASKETAEFYGPNKPRTVDPLVLQAGALTRLSAIVPGIGVYFDEFNAAHQNLGVVQQA